MFMGGRICKKNWSDRSEIPACASRRIFCGLSAASVAARFGFAIEDATWAALKEKANGITRISAERIFQELDKILIGRTPTGRLRSCMNRDCLQ